MENAKHDLLKNIVEYLDLIYQGIKNNKPVLVKDLERKIFVSSVVDYIDTTKTGANIVIEDLKEDALGMCVDGKFLSTIMVDEDCFDKINNEGQNSAVNVVDLLMVICHELTHVQQSMILSGKYNKGELSKHYSTADTDTRRIIDSLTDVKIEKKLNAQDLRLVVNLLEKYDKTFANLDGVSDEDISDLLGVYYWSRECEISARSGEIKKTASLLTDVFESEFASPELKKWLKVEMLPAFKKFVSDEIENIRITEKNLEILKKYVPDLTIDELLDIDRKIVLDDLMSASSVELAEKSQKDLKDSLVFKNLLRIQFKSIKSEPDRLEILAKVCEEGTSNFLNMLIDAFGASKLSYNPEKMRQYQQLLNKVCGIMKKGEFTDANSIYSLVVKLSIESKDLFSIIRSYVKNNQFEYIAQIVRALEERHLDENLETEECKVARKILKYVYREARLNLQKLIKKQQLTNEDKLLIQSLFSLFNEKDKEILDVLFDKLGVDEKEFYRCKDGLEKIAERADDLELYEIDECSDQFRDNPQHSQQYYIDLKNLQNKKLAEEKVYGKKYADFSYGKGLAVIERRESKRREVIHAKELKVLENGRKIMREKHTSVSRTTQSKKSAQTSQNDKKSRQNLSSVRKPKVSGDDSVSTI